MSGLNSFFSIDLDSFDNKIVSYDFSSKLPQVVNGTTIPTSGEYAKGCLFTKTDVGAGTPAVYQNTGTTSAPVFTLMDTALPGDSASKLIDTNSVTVVDVATVASTVNNLRVTGSATGAVSANAVSLNPVGSDAAISLSLAPKGATGLTTIGLATGTGDIILGLSSATQSVKIGGGTGASSVLIANGTTAGVSVFVAGQATGAGITDLISIASGNAAATGIKQVDILTGTAGTSGNNRLTMGGGAASAITLNGVVTSNFAMNRTTGTAVANAPVATLVNASGSNVTVATGLRITLTLASTLQAAGANTLNLNGHGADAIKSHLNPANDIATAYATGGIVDLVFNGTVWMDMSQ